MPSNKTTQAADLAEPIFPAVSAVESVFDELARCIGQVERAPELTEPVRAALVQRLKAQQAECVNLGKIAHRALTVHREAAAAVGG